MMKRALMFAAAAAVLSACSSMPGGMMMGDAPMAGPMASPTPATAAYAAAAGDADLFEVTSSQTALMRTQNADVRRFATMMIDHHTGTTNALLAAAARAGVALPPAVLSPQKRTMIEQLSAQTGAAFDRLYVQQQVMAHQEALAVHSGYAQTGDTPAIRAAAAAAAAIVQRHLTEVQAMQTSMGAMGM